MSVQWTKDQQEVIDSRNCSLLVSAAAGSGKTAVLVERIIRMITDDENPMSIDRLLVMTFTRAAASEMRERILAAIEKKLEENPENQHLQQQAVMVQFAQITTIDSFCLHILREHFDSLEIDPAFRVGDEGELLLMRADVMREMLDDYYNASEERFEHFVDAYASGKADGGIDDLIMQVYTFSQSNPWPEDWIEACRRELDSCTLEELNETKWMKFLLRDVYLQVQDWRSSLTKAIKLCYEEDGPHAYIPMITEDLDAVERLLQSLDSYEVFCAALQRIRFSRLAAIRGTAALSVDSEKKDAVMEYRGKIKKAVEKMQNEYVSASPEQVLSDLEHSRDGILMLLKLAEEFSARFQERKREKRLVDFNDLEHFALRILTDEDHEPGIVADELSSQYDEVLVDEYQDSNLVQETLINCVSRERFGTPNVFMVGDVKQSIYKFRLACPELFLEKYNLYGIGLMEKKRKIELHQNFRSREQVLNSINDVFFRIMTENLGEIEYTEETALYPGAEYEPREHTEDLNTELLLVDTAEDALKELDDDVSDYTSRELEAGMAAERIRELTDPVSGFMVWDKERGCYRRAEYRDIVVLLRSLSGWAEPFTEVLGRQGIPAYVESRTGYFNTIEVETVLNLLMIIDNPLQDIPLASVLKAPFGGFSEEELAHMAAFTKRRTDRKRELGLFESVLRYLEEGNKEDSEREKNFRPDLFKKLEALMMMIEKLRRMSVYLPMHELLYRLYDLTGYYHYVTALPGGEVRRANLDMLVEKAASYESTSYRGVFHFIRYIEKLKKYKTDFGEASVGGEESNTVRVMTIHKSKGLEFPIVILAGMGKQFNKKDTTGMVLIDSEFGIGTDYLDSERRIKGATLKKNIMKRQMNLSALGEELRVLYVAMTRAKEKLIMTAAVKRIEDQRRKYANLLSDSGRVPFTVLTSASSYLDWIFMSLSGGRVRISVQEIPAAAQLNSEIAKQLEKNAEKAYLSKISEDTVFAKDFRRRLTEADSFRYPHEADMVLNTKMSVSDLKKAGMEEEQEEAVVLPSLPAFMKEEEKELTGALRGTAYHRALELLDFTMEEITDSEIRRQLSVFVETKRMTKEAADCIHVKDIRFFLLSDLGKRMRQAAKKGLLKKETQFVIGIPARKMGEWDSDELILVQGIIDAYFEEEDALILMDYKTDYVTEAETLKARYAVQLEYYVRALEQMTGKKVKERMIYSFRLGTISF